MIVIGVHVIHALGEFTLIKASVLCKYRYYSDC
uniref:Uncharacterized protein n=1 Tax=Anguilla anguilla TaxID=7936 RepID=A0A0E9RJ41_ANGAN